MTSRAVKKIDVKKAVEYIKQYGGEVDILRLKHFLGGMSFSEALRTLSKYQFPNGGWYYEDDPTKTLSIGASTLWLRVLLELELTNTAS